MENKSLPADKYYYAGGTQAELQHRVTEGRPDYPRLHRSEYYQYNTWRTLESAISWASYLEASSYSLEPPEVAKYEVLVLR